MNEFKTDDAAEISQGSASSPRWTGAPSIALAHELNEQCVELVCVRSCRIFLNRSAPAIHFGEPRPLAPV
jgi:phosphoenolpyruvate carboxylase